MSVADEEAPSDSFWEIGQFKRTVIRVDNGQKLCDDFMSFMKERAQIEEQYAKLLRGWSAKYKKLIEKGPCYHTLEQSWMSILRESDRVADLHHDIREKLMLEDYEKVKAWKKENYHSLTLGGLKETKIYNDEFSKAQKSWAKQYKKVMDTKKAYYQACKEEKTAQMQEAAAKGDQIAADKLKKLEELVEKKSADRQKHREKYENMVSELDSQNSRYMEDMENVFEKCQSFENKRLDFTKEVMLSVHTHLDLSTNSEFQSVYSDLHNDISRASANDDLTWWHANHGPGMAMNWPQFEEYDPEKIHLSRTISKKQGMKASKHIAGGSDNVVGAVFTQNSEYETSYPETNTNNGETNRVASWSDDEANPFDGVSEGVEVQALYDYDGAEEDELSFKAGDTLYKLEDEDEQGWCKGRTKDGAEGLYPANYVKVA